MSESLLPPNATALELALEGALSTPPLPVPIATLWNPETCPERLLPWLAHALSVDFWEPDWPEETKRRVIRESVQVHRKKGTRRSVERALGAMGVPPFRIVEKYGHFLDGTWTLDGSVSLGGIDHWAEYRVFVDAPITIAQGELVRAILKDTAPVRSHLKHLDFVAAANTLDGTWVLDGTYSLGVA